MTAAPIEITRDDIMPVEEYAKLRKDKRSEVTKLKKNRRMEVGPYATFYFESYDTMWHQIHEMLYIERGGEAQIADELSAYNPLIPQGKELVATVMFEIPDEIHRRRVLSRLGGVEQNMFIQVGDIVIDGVPETDVDRTTAEGKASSVQFVHFPFTDDQIAAFKDTGKQAVLGIKHENYSHMAVMPPAVREALVGDFA